MQKQSGYFDNLALEFICSLHTPRGTGVEHPYPRTVERDHQGIIRFNRQAQRALSNYKQLKTLSSC